MHIMYKYMTSITLLVFIASCGGGAREAWQITRILQQRCQQSAVEDELCEVAEKQRQRLPAILEFMPDEQVFLTIADVNNGEDLSYLGQQTDQNLHFITQQQRFDPDTDCRYNRIDALDLQIDGDLIEGEQNIRVEQSAACTTTGWSLLTRQVWLWRGHRLQAASAVDEEE